ncbi:importin alpha [Pelomyxa schiedti]|nr:importin alpha [Pelomyxa schiedti]
MDSLIQSLKEMTEDQKRRRNHRAAPRATITKHTTRDRGKHEEFTIKVNVRKNRREAESLKRRTLSDIVARAANNAITTTVSAPAPSSMAAPSPPGVEFETLAQMVAACMGNDTSLHFPATQQIRQLLSVETLPPHSVPVAEHNPPIAEVIDSGVLPRLVQFLSVLDNPKLQFEAAWAITNIASGTSKQTQAVIETGAVPLLIGLMSSPDPELREQAVWGLGNIAGDSSTYRDYVIRVGIVPPLIRLVAQDSTSISLIRNATWTISNLCRGKPPPDFSPIKPVLPTLCALLQYNDIDVLTDALWGLSYLSDGGEIPNQAILEAGICRVVVPLLSVNNVNMQIPAMRALGNIVTGTHTQTQGVIDAGLLPAMGPLLKNPKKCIKKEACWVLSNVAAGTREQVAAIINADLIPPLIQCMSSTDMEIKKEACWAICNAVSGGGSEHIGSLISQNFIEPMCLLLSCGDTKMVTVIIETIETVLKTGDAYCTPNSINPFVQVIEQSHGVLYLEMLQEHSSDRIYSRVFRLLEDYFHMVDSEGESDNNTSGSCTKERKSGDTSPNLSQP